MAPTTPPAPSAPDPAFEPVSRTPLSLLVAQQLRERIVSGGLPLGTQLPGEHELAESFAVSRPTVREALRILQAQGLLTGGDRVSTARPRVSDARTVDSAAAALENVLRLGQVPLPDLVQLRVLVEGAALRGAAGRGRATRLEEPRTALGAMRHAAAAGDPQGFHAADVAFHVALVAEAGNAAYDLVLAVLREAIAGHLHEALAAIADPRPTLDRLLGEHRAILTAVEAGDGEEAAALVAAHIAGFYADRGGPAPTDGRGWASR